MNQRKKQKLTFQNVVVSWHQPGPLPLVSSSSKLGNVNDNPFQSAIVILMISDGMASFIHHYWSFCLKLLIFCYFSVIFSFLPSLHNKLTSKIYKIMILWSKMITNIIILFIKWQIHWRWISLKMWWHYWWRLDKIINDAIPCWIW